MQRKVSDYVGKSACKRELLKNVYTKCSTKDYFQLLYSYRNEHYKHFYGWDINYLHIFFFYLRWDLTANCE